MSVAQNSVTAHGLSQATVQVSAGMRSSGSPRRALSSLKGLLVGFGSSGATEQRLPEVLCHVSLPRAAHNPAAGFAQGKSKGGSFYTLTLDMTSHPFYHILCIRSISPGPAHTGGERMPRNVSHKLHNENPETC